MSTHWILCHVFALFCAGVDHDLYDFLFMKMMMTMVTFNLQLIGIVKPLECFRAALMRKRG
jgi:hypothetical protein